jgi:hypothetical protein
MRAANASAMSPNASWNPAPLAAFVGLSLLTAPARAAEPEPAPTPNVVIEGAPSAAPPTAEVGKADPGPSWVAPSTRGGAPARRWYGWQTLILDGAALATWGAAGTGGGSGVLAVAGLGVYLLGPPIVHFAHGHVGKGFGDILMRVGLPLGLGALGYAAGSDDCRGGDFCLPTSALYAGLGVLIGYGGAVAIDAALLAREDVGPEPLRTGKRPLFEWAPDIRTAKDRATLGVRGSF